MHLNLSVHRELREENLRLMDLLKGKGGVPKPGSDGMEAASQEGELKGNQVFNEKRTI